MQIYKFNINSIYLILIAFGFIFNQCTTKPADENKDSIVVNKLPENQKVDNVSLPAASLFSSILLTKNEMERASFIGTKINQITIRETAEVADSASNYKGFTQYFNNSDDEFVDIQYFNNGEVITALNFDIYLNNQKDVENLYDELVLKFNNKYGKSVVGAKENKWQLPKNQTLLLKDVSVKLAPGLQLQFAIKNANTTIE